MKRICPIFVLLAMSLGVALGQEYTFHSYARALDNLAVNVMQQDSQGFIWIGTESGLIRFDGNRFVEFGRESGLADRFVVGLAQDVTGRLWVATRSGLAYRSGTDHFQTVTYNNHPLSFGSHPPLAMPPWGGVIVGTPYGLLSLSVSDGKSEWHSLIPPGNAFAVNPKSITSVLARRDGSILFGCGTGICKLENGSLIAWGPERGLPPGKWVRMFERFNGEVWARSTNHIVRLQDGASRFETFDLPAKALPTDSTALVEDSAGRILAGLYSGVARFENGKWDLITERNGMAEGTVKALLIDGENQPWLGLSGSGIANWLGYDQWQHWTKRQGLASNSVWALLHDSRGRLWAGHDRGVDILDPASDTFRNWQHARGPSETVRSIVESKDGFLWIGNFSGRLQQVDIRNLRVVAETKLDSIERIFIDSTDRIWIATDNTLLASEGSGLQRKFKPVPELAKFHDFNDVQQASNGDIWALTETGLLWRSSAQTPGQDTWQRIDISQAGLGNLTADLAFDHDGWLWVDSQEFGAVRFKIVQGRIVASQRLKLNSSHVVFMAADTRGWMWIGEDNGLEVFDGVSLYPYSIDNGLIWNDCNSKAFATGKDGAVFVGTSGGISQFTGDKLPIALPSKPILTNIQYGSRHLSNPSASIRFQRDSLTFTIAAMTFRDQKNLIYRYRLLGLEDNWNETATPEVRYPTLSPRAYRFEVATVNVKSGHASPVESFDIEIIPPWYLTRTFGIAVFLAVVYLGVLIWRGRVRLLVARQRELENLVLDRTEELNRRLKQQEQLQIEAERANRAKSDFLAMMSHEIRTPMNGVIGMTTMLESTELSCVQTDYVKTIRESGSSLLSIINDILDFSKIEAGKLNLENIEFRLLECIEEPLSVIRETARRKGIHLIVHSAPNLPSRLMGDPVRIKQVLLNLLSNAVKFTNEGSVELRTYPGESSTSESAQIIFEVKDSGIGISPETQQRLFQSFTQAETSTTRKYGGTGLGLVICKRLVEMLGGDIGVDSDLGRGSTFRVVLNLQLPTYQNQENRLPESAAKQVPAPASQKKVLVAEDNQINQKVALRMLSLLGYHADIAENGAEALRLLENGRYDAVLMDMHMPVMDGLEATRAIRGLEGALSRIPIIAVTANALQGERQKCLAAGMNDFISKPIEKDKFAATLERWTSDHPENQLLSA